MDTFYLLNSTRKNKLFMVKFINPKTNMINTIHFGNRASSQFPIHKNVKTKENYLNRHHNREDWTNEGIDTPGFWSRWILWNKPSIDDSIKDTENRFDIIINKI